MGARPVGWLFAVLVPCAGCVEALPDARQAELVAVMTRADEPLLRSRPDLVAGKYRRMSGSPFAYLRGSFPIWLADSARGTVSPRPSEFALDEPLVLGIGDVHPENFGTLRAPDGALTIEPNDFDAADAYPYLWEVRRLVVALVVASRESNASDRDARRAAFERRGRLARAAALGYADAIEALAAGAPPVPLDAEALGDDLILAGLLAGAVEDGEARTELDELTVLDDTGRHLRRGSLDPADPESRAEALPGFAARQLPEVLARVRSTLPTPPPGDELTVLDAVRELGSGVASWPRVRLLLLLRGPSDEPQDDRIVELRELADSGAPGTLPPGVLFDRVEERVIDAARVLWSRPDADPLWGTTRWLGLPVQVRSVTGLHRTVRVRRLHGDLGSPEALERLGHDLGGLLARMHASGGVRGQDAARRIAARLAGRHHAFAVEQEDVAVAYADLLAIDFLRFRDALERLGPTLGLEASPADAPSDEVQAVFGTVPALPAP